MLSVSKYPGFYIPIMFLNLLKLNLFSILSLNFLSRLSNPLWRLFNFPYRLWFFLFLLRSLYLDIIFIAKFLMNFRLQFFIRHHQLFIGVHGYLIKYWIYHVEHAFVPKFILVSDQVEFFAVLVLYVLRQKGFFRLHFP